MLHPQSRRGSINNVHLARERGLILTVALIAAALVLIHATTFPVASKSVKSAAGMSTERANTRIAPAGRAANVAAAPLSLLAPMAAIAVDRTDDAPSASVCSAAPNDCSLRGAVAFANLNMGTTINVPAGNYSLTIPGGFAEGFSGNNSIGDLDILGNNTSIVGAGASSTIIQQTQANDRVIEVNPFLDAGFSTSISGVTITGGHETTAIGGGGIISGSIANTLTLTNCVISGNSATGAGTFGGGGVSHAGGTLNVSGCTFSNNSTTGSGGAIGYSAGDPIGRTPSTGSLIVTASSFSSNSAGSLSAGGGGLDLFNFNGGLGTYNISTSSFTNNSATAGRGGAVVVESGLLTISYSRLVDNSASAVGNGQTIFAGAQTVADDNWWGVNAGPSVDDIAGPGEGPTPTWLQLRHSANPNPICAGSSTTLTADIRDRNAGTDLTTELNGLPAFPAQFINTTPLLGSVTGGTNFVDGVASALFTAGATTGTAVVDVAADHETQSASVLIQGNDTTDPANVEMCEHGTASFTTTTSGPGPVSYVWKQGTTVLNNGDLGGRVTITSGSNSSTLSITNIQSGDANTYSVEANGSCNTVSQSATLTVNTAPLVTQNPVSQTVTPGNSVTFTAAASGSPTPTVQWQVSTDNGGSFNNIPGATNTSLTFTTQASDDGHQFRAVFTNSCGTATTTAAVLTTCVAASVTGSPASVADACVGTTINFSASATGVPTPTVQWQISTTGGGMWSNIPGATSTTLSVTVTAALNNSQYRAVFTNDCGTDTTAAATLGVDSIAPVITLSPTVIKLWPPNHSYKTVTVSELVASVSDNCGVVGGVTIASVSSDEPENGAGDGSTVNDIVIANDCQSVQLRAERQEGGNGRVYRINLRVKDTAGNSGTVTAYVYAPVSHGETAIDDGPAAGYTVNGNCP